MKGPLVITGSLLLLGLGVTAASWSAEGAPDVLGLQQLAQLWQTSADEDTTLPFILEERFIMERMTEEGTSEPTFEAEARQSMVTWLNEYAKSQVLFRSEDLGRLREALPSVSDEQFLRWMADSRALRERLSGDSWQQTQRWLRDFLAAQAIYSSSELAALRTRLAGQAPSRLMRVLDHFQTVHLSRLRSAQAADQFRQQRLLSLGSMRPAPRTVQPASFSSGNAFPSASAPPVNPTTRYSLIRRPTLSQRVSNYYIYRGVFGNRNGFLWWMW